ncbi:hypothetical protein ACFPOE_17515 [Caenimonas terrae]|uniref:Stress-induced protein n=1 Tax=Caenimonas terrae TaxID=696074 RepID=A0ABW0NIH2_9BURK
MASSSQRQQGTGAAGGQDVARQPGQQGKRRNTDGQHNRGFASVDPERQRQVRRDAADAAEPGAADANGPGGTTGKGA